MHSLRVIRRNTGWIKLPLMVAIVVAVVGAACTEPAPEPTPVSTRQAVSRVETKTYVVREQDTLALISLRTGIAVAELVELNAIADPNLIELGEILLLEATVVPRPNLERSIVSREPEDRSLSTSIRDWWAGLYRPSLNLSDSALSQGAVAGLMLPVAVLTFVAIWLGWQGVRRAASAMNSLGSRAFAGVGPRFAVGGSGGGVASLDTHSPPRAEASPSIWTRLKSSVAPRLTRSRSRAWRLPRPRIQGLPRRRWGRTARSFPRPSINFGAMYRPIGLIAKATLRGLRRFSAVPALFIRQLEARRERRATEATRGEAAAHWLTGIERLRIGLLDEAYSSFEAALHIARENGWADEVERNLAALDDIAERRASGSQA